MPIDIDAMPFEVHFNLEFINKNVHSMIKHTIREPFEWATFWYINRDHSMNVCRCVKKKNGPSYTLLGSTS